MGIIRDAAKEIVKDVMVTTGAGVLAGAGEAIEKFSEKQNAKKEKRVSTIFKATSFFDKYKNHMLAMCSEKEDKRTYVFSSTDNQIKYMTDRPFNMHIINLYDFDEKIIGSVSIGLPVKNSFFGPKVYSRQIKLIIGSSQIGTVDVEVNGRNKSIKLCTYFWNIWLKNSDSIIEADNDFKMSPIDKLAKKAYQIGFSDPGQEVLLALIFIAVKEAKVILDQF